MRKTRKHGPVVKRKPAPRHRSAIGEFERTWTGTWLSFYVLGFYKVIKRSWKIPESFGTNTLSHGQPHTLRLSSSATFFSFASHVGSSEPTRNESTQQPPPDARPREHYPQPTEYPWYNSPRIFSKHCTTFL